MKSNKLLPWSVIIGCCFFLFCGLASPLLAEDAVTLRKRVDDRYEGDDSTGKTILKLQKITRNGEEVTVNAERLRVTTRFTKAYSKDSKSVMFFLEPADVRGTGFLSYAYDDESKDNDQWLYLPALKKVKRIASSDKSGSFMGTDFSYVDIGGIKVDKYNHRYLINDDLKALMKEESVMKLLQTKFGKTQAGFEKAQAWFFTSGVKVVESIPKDKTTLNEDGYARFIAWIDPETLTTEKALYFGKNDKVFKLMEMLEKQKIQEIWTFTKMVMENFSKSHRTIIEMQETHYNTGIKDNYFTQRTLTQGP
ncbi:outer membrane lipoprotein-sorting protein [Deltaproteobacteria bacterium TL4]